MPQGSGRPQGSCWAPHVRRKQSGAVYHPKEKFSTLVKGGAWERPVLLCGCPLSCTQRSQRGEPRAAARRQQCPGRRAQGAGRRCVPAGTSWRPWPRLGRQPQVPRGRTGPRSQGNAHPRAKGNPCRRQGWCPARLPRTWEHRAPLASVGGVPASALCELVTGCLQTFVRAGLSDSHYGRRIQRPAHRGFNAARPLSSRGLKGVNSALCVSGAG